jgi:inorganic pyrophosphatase/exopolyphosphatase
MKKFKEYLRAASAAYGSLKSTNFNVCIGNVSADMDSIVGSLLLSYFLTSSGNLTYPNINCTKDDIKSRLDVYKVLERNEITADLIFHDQAYYHQLRESNHIKVVLFDHNTPDINQNYLLDDIDMIVDHHSIYKSIKAKCQNIQPCGSATSLVINLFGKGTDWDTDLALFAASPILMDCDNFSPASMTIKWNQIDVNAFNVLQPCLVGINTQHYYQELISSKFDIKAILNLGLDNILAADYKNYNISNDFKYGSSVVSVSPSLLQSKFGNDAINKSIASLMEKKGIQLYLLNSVCADSKTKMRALLLISPNKLLLSKLESKMLDLPVFKNGQDLIKKPIPEIPNAILYHLLHPKITRKILEPVLNELLQLIV